jgi:hypothetical protein
MTSENKRCGCFLGRMWRAWKRIKKAYLQHLKTFVDPDWSQMNDE